MQLIINKSDLPKAIGFQISAAHLVYSYMRGELKPSKWATNRDLLAASLLAAITGHLFQLNINYNEDQEKLWLLCKEGLTKAAMD